MKIFIFGDSFSCRFDDDNPWARKYVRYKGYTPKNFGDIIGELLGSEVINCAFSGLSNYDIFHTIIEKIESIQKDDIIIIEFSSVYRYRLVDKFGNFSSISAQWNWLFHLFNESEDAIKEIGVNRTSKVYLTEIDDWIKSITKMFPDNKTIFWTPFIESTGNPMIIPFYQFSTIGEETDLAVNDTHYSETGHWDLANYILGKIKEVPKKML